MDFTERMLERNRSRQNKSDAKESANQSSVPLKEVHRNTVTTTTTSVDIKKHPGTNKVTIETTVTMRNFPKNTSNPINKETVDNEEETTTTEGEAESTDEKENITEPVHCPLRQDTKHRLQRLGVLYSDDPSRLSSPIHRTEDQFFKEEKAEDINPAPKSSKSTARTARFAMLADTINHWEDDPRHFPVGSRFENKSPTKTSNLTKHSVFSNKKNYDEHRKFVSPQKRTEVRQNEDSSTRVSPRKQSPPKAMTSNMIRKQTTPERIVPSILKQPSDKRVSPYRTKSSKNIVWDKSVIDALEAQGFSRSESSQKLIYHYDNDKSKTPSPTKSTAVSGVEAEFPQKKSPSPTKFSPAKTESPQKQSPVKQQSPTKFSPAAYARTESPQKKSPVKQSSPVKDNIYHSKYSSPVRESTKVREPSPVKGRYGSPIQMGMSAMKARETAIATATSSDEDSSAPTMGVKQLCSPRKAASPVRGSVLDRAQRYEQSTSPTKRRDPAELPLAERLALFERNAGAAVLPKAPFGMPVPAKKLQTKVTSMTDFRTKQQFAPSSSSSSLLNSGSSTNSLHDRMAVFERSSSSSDKEHIKVIISEREKEMEMLRHRWDRYKGSVEEEINFEPSAPAPTPPPMAPPLPPPPQPLEYGSRRHSSYFEEEEEEEPLPDKPELAYPVLKQVKKIKLSPPKPGCIYPCLSDIEVESEVQESETEGYENNRSSSSETSMESDLHSLGQDIVKISRSNLKRDWPVSEQLGQEDHDNNEIDDFLDEAFEDSSDEPTPPKRVSYSHNAGTVHSRSFEYSHSKENQSGQNHPLLHTVSFYRKQQNMTLRPPSPTRHIDIDPSSYSTDDSVERMEEELDRELKMVEEKIEMLQQEVRKQQIIIAQASQALNLCCSTIEFSGSTEQLEAEKLLLLATQRRQAAQREIQRLRVEQTIRPQAPGNKTLTERGSLTLSNITVPLKMDVVHHAAKDDQCYYLVCLVHTDERVYCTDIMCAPRSLHHHNKLTFPNKFALDGLYSDFKVTLEVYTMTARSKEIIPHDVKYHINTNRKDASKLKLTPRKGKGDCRLLMPSVQSPGGPSVVRTSSFNMAGYVIFSLREIHRKQFTLNKNAYTSVLEGSLHVQIETEMSMDVEFRGFLTMFEDVSGFGAWHRRWCLLKGDKLSYWKYPDDERKKIALDTIELSSCVTQEVDVVPRDVCARPNTFLLETSRPARSTDLDSLVLIRNGNTSTIRHLLSADTKEDRIQWCNHLNKALALMRAWGITSK